MTAHGFFLYGMWGPVTDPGARTMTQRMAAELPINMHDSPYRDYDVNSIVSIIMELPAYDKVIVAGTSLGSNNTPVVGAYAYLQNKSRIIHGMWGFQASIWGAHAEPGTSYPGITPNVLFASLAYSTNPINGGLGTYVWEKAPGNSTTNLYSFDTKDIHPGDGNVVVQNKFLAEMKRVIGAAA
jgi:hypothetical protein